MGIICPLFSFFWAILSAGYYFLIHPYILSALSWLSQNLAYSFFIGMYFGVLAVDFGYSVHLLTNIRKFANDKGIIVKYEELKVHIEKFKERTHEHSFMLALHSKSASLAEQMTSYFESHFKNLWVELKEKVTDNDDKKGN